MQVENNRDTRLAGTVSLGKYVLIRLQRSQSPFYKLWRGYTGFVYPPLG